MITPLARRRRSTHVTVGDIICHGRYAVTAVKNPGVGIGVTVSAVDSHGEPELLRWNGHRWAIEGT